MPLVVPHGVWLACLRNAKLVEGVVGGGEGRKGEERGEKEVDGRKEGFIKARRRRRSVLGFILQINLKPHAFRLTAQK